jgi:hypothetical protein
MRRASVSGSVVVKPDRANLAIEEPRLAIICPVLSSGLRHATHCPGHGLPPCLPSAQVYCPRSAARD